MTDFIYYKALRKKFLAGTANVGEEEMVARWLVMTYMKDKEAATNFVKLLNKEQRLKLYRHIVDGELELEAKDMEQTHRWLRVILEDQ